MVQIDEERLKKQIDFIVEVDKLKSIYRQTTLIDKSRKENDAEHSWHLSIMALLLSEYADNKDIDLLKVIKMLIVHDLVEIDAGDTFAYDVEGYKDKEERENKAANRIFGLLPKDQFNEVYNLWREFEIGETNEAKFAGALDRIQPMLHNYYTNGGTWKEHNVKSDQVLKRCEGIFKGSKTLGEFAQDIIDESIKREYIQK